MKKDLESIMDAAYPVHHYRHIASGHLIKIYEMVHIAPESFFAKRLKQWEEDVAAGFVLHHEGVVGESAERLSDDSSTKEEQSQAGQDLAEHGNDPDLHPENN